MKAKYAFEIMQVDQVTIGVFENNIPALQCYLSVGFRKSEDKEDSYEMIEGEKWKIIELAISKEEYQAGTAHRRPCLLCHPIIPPDPSCPRPWSGR